MALAAVIVVSAASTDVWDLAVLHLNGLATTACQVSFACFTPSSENETSTSSGSTITANADPSVSTTVGADTTDTDGGEEEMKPTGAAETLQTNGTENTLPGPSIPSVLEQQLAAAAFQLPPPPPPPPQPEGVICIAHALASVADDYSKKPNVFRLRTKDGSEYLLQVNDPKELEYWVDKINYVAGLLSSPSLPSAVGSDQTFHRPILPAGVTHLGVVSSVFFILTRIQSDRCVIAPRNAPLIQHYVCF
ncbi:unnamed protein product [Rodentolepis nana]|uniref:PH domain-containing protein n=1 Tax=Rodentolepis nana TaxID=102285 RepID=A0A0R3TYE4_RODNA|nr:unnamed protein product [Rodentolepis nana]